MGNIRWLSVVWFRMKTKEYKFKEGFSIKTRLSPDGSFFAMGETCVCESIVFDLYKSDGSVETYETFYEAKEVGMLSSLNYE